MARSRSLLIQGIIVCSITALLVEAASLGYIAATQHRFHYTTPPVQLSNSTEWSTQSARLHPYFGFYSELALFPPLPPDVPAQATQATQDEALVGIFGGSVALSFYFAQTQTNVLRDALQALPRFAGRKVRIVNLSHSGYKQPQQLNILNYYLANGLKLEVIINIDGLNEIGFNSVNIEHGMDISMPMAPLFSDLVRKCKGEDAADETACAMVQAKNQALRLQTAAEGSPLAAGYVLYSVRSRLARSRFWALSKAPRQEDNATAMVAYTRASGPPESPEALARSVRTWRYGSLAMLQMARMAGAELFEFIQPNQYFQTDRVMGDAERAVAWNNSSILLRSVNPGYGLMFQELDGLRAAGLRIYDMTRVFDDVAEPLYVDTCCHVNAKGNALQEAFIAEIVTRDLGAQTAP